MGITTQSIKSSVYKTINTYCLILISNSVNFNKKNLLKFYINL